MVILDQRGHKDCLVKRVTRAILVPLALQVLLVHKALKVYKARRAILGRQAQMVQTVLMA
jgi:BarA-like signal transduction histidine kinase